MEFNPIKNYWRNWMASAQEKKEINEQLAIISSLENEARAMDDYAGGSWGHVKAAQDRLDVLKTRRWRRIATKFDVPFPSPEIQGMYNRMEWDYDNSESVFLTDKGVEEVRRRIRDEQRYRREVAGFWITSVTGLLGTIIGVLSFFRP